MKEYENTCPPRALFLICNPRLAEKATRLFEKSDIHIRYEWNGVGTAPNEMIDILGLGNPDKKILVSLISQRCVYELQSKMKKELRLGTVNSGIAFTVALTGINAQLLRMINSSYDEAKDKSKSGKDGFSMSERKYSLIAAVINQGFSEEVMDVARSVGAGGGTVIHTRDLSGKEALSFWGMSIQEEKEVLFIVANDENKESIMKAIGEKYGMKSDAKGVVLSLPIDSVAGIE